MLKMDKWIIVSETHGKKVNGFVKEHICRSEGYVKVVIKRERILNPKITSYAERMALDI
jgi:hypothetical protein